MTARACTGFCFKLTPYGRVCFSTLKNPTLAYEKLDIKREPSPPSKRPRYQPPDYVTRVKNAVKLENLMTNEDFKCIYNSVVTSRTRLEKKFTAMNTVMYLLGLGFSKDVILESSPICFYDRSRIEEALKKIKDNESRLEEVGLKRGFAKSETHNFSRGTHLCDKRLQLCLYYMEKPSGFSFTSCKSFIKKISCQKKKEVEELKIL